MTLDPPPARQPEPVATGSQTSGRLARGVSRGFAEASEAFSNEVAETSGYTDLLQRTVAGVIRANGRFLEEIAGAVREAGDDLARQCRRPTSSTDIDYERLADLVAARLGAGPVTPGTAPDATVVLAAGGD
jgi:hypothetical protein